MRYFWLFCALGALLGCRQVSEPSGQAIALYCSTYQGAKTESLTVGEEVAVFAGPEGTEDYFLEAAKFTVGADGRSLTYGSTVYYPDPKQAVRFLAYFPYHKGTFSVPTDQSTATALKEADLCGATASTTPVAAPVALEFRHLMARLVITTKEPTTKITFPNAVASGVVHAATAELVLGTVRKDIWTTGNELIVPVQPLSRLVLTVSGVEYVFDTAPIALEAGKTTTLDLTLHPATKTATLSGSSVTDWVATTTPGNLTQAVSNTLTVHWPKSHPQSNAVDRIVLTVKDETSGVTANYTVTNGITYANQTFTIPFASLALHYPYTIVSVALYQNNTEWLHESPNVLGGTIIKSGACVVGIRQPLNPPTADDYVTIDGLNWAKGNLIALNNRECKVGAPADGGLYFQFGSLIGYKGGNQINGGTGVGIPKAPLTTDGTYWNGVGYSWESDAIVWPSAMTKTPTAWPANNGSEAGDRNTVVDQWFFNYNVAPYSTAGQNIRDFPNLAIGGLASSGVGDPCTYYLGGTWRLPKNAEYFALFGKVANDTAWGSVAGWTWRGSPPGAIGSIFFPASGYRDHPDGSFNGVTAAGYGWGSSIGGNAIGGHAQSFNSSSVSPQRSYHRSYGFPVRCVSE